MLRDAALHNFCYAFMTTIRTLSRSVEDMEAVWAAPQPLAPLSAALLRKLLEARNSFFCSIYQTYEKRNLRIGTGDIVLVEG